MLTRPASRTQVTYMSGAEMATTETPRTVSEILRNFAITAQRGSDEGADARPAILTARESAMYDGQLDQTLAELRERVSEQETVVEKVRTYPLPTVSLAASDGFISCKKPRALIHWPSRRPTRLCACDSCNSWPRRTKRSALLSPRYRRQAQSCPRCSRCARPMA